MRLVGVADRRTASLIRARRATNASCFQHTAEMVRRLDYDALLIGGGRACRRAGGDRRGARSRPAG